MPRFVLSPPSNVISCMIFSCSEVRLLTFSFDIVSVVLRSDSLSILNSSISFLSFSLTSSLSISWSFSSLLAKRDEKLQDIDSDDVREKLKKEIDELRIERESLRNTTDTISKEKVKSLTSEQENIIQEITLEGGESTKRGIIRKSKYDKVKTEYLLESLEESGYLHGTYMSEYDDYVYALTTSSKKLMVDKGVAK